MFLAADGLLAFLIFAFWIYCLFDVITAESTLVRNLPKGFWVILVILLFDIGGLAWIILGRPLNTGFVPGQPEYRPPRRSLDAPPRRRAVGPEDSPEFEDRIRRARERELKEWEDELNRREDELKRREGGDSNL
jgi:hypothetical protein